MFNFLDSRGVLALAVGGMTVGGAASPGLAASLAVELACASDYYSYCSQYDSDGDDVRKCMRLNGLKLSRICVKALVSAGEMTPEEEHAYAKATKK
jgi:hypothetical protein